MDNYIRNVPWHAQEKLRDVQAYSRPRSWSLGRALGTPENFQKFVKLLKEIAKITLFSPIFQNFQNPALNFRAFGSQTQLLGNVEKIFYENSNEKLNL